MDVKQAIETLRYGVKTTLDSAVPSEQMVAAVDYLEAQAQATATNSAMDAIAERLDEIAADIANAGIHGFGNQVSEVAERVRQQHQ